MFYFVTVFWFNLFGCFKVELLFFFNGDFVEWDYFYGGFFYGILSVFLSGLNYVIIIIIKRR